MYSNKCRDKEMYNHFMLALEEENAEYIKLQSSEAYRYGRYIKRIKENFLHPAVLAKKIKATREANRIKRSYPRHEKKKVQKNENDYFLDDRIAIYTAIFGNYDSLLEPTWVPDNCDFYIVTDQPIPNESEWKLLDIDWKSIGINGNVKRNRYCKMFPHKLPVIKDYKYSIYIDGNVKPVTDFSAFINRLDEDGMGFHLHSSRDCVYEEAKVCIYSGKDTKESINAHMEYLRKQGFPEHYGMLECNLIARSHENPVMKKVMEMWWNEFCARSKRDQLSLPYVLFKNGINVESVGVLGNNIFQNYALRVVKHE